MTASEPVPSPTELLAPLVDMTDNGVSGDPCTLVFHFRRSDGPHLSLTLRQLTECLQLLISTEIVPDIPDYWMIRATNTHGDDIQTQTPNAEAHKPWHVCRDHSLKADHLALGDCPHCDRPIRFRALFLQSNHSMQTGSRYVPVTDKIIRKRCRSIFFLGPRQRRRRPGDSRGRKKSPPLLANPICNIAVRHFDTCIDILSEDLGFRPSYGLARRWLLYWFAARAYLYPRATQGNVPWMIAWFGRSENLQGQILPTQSALARAIVDKVPEADFNERGQLQTRGDFLSIKVKCTRYRNEQNSPGQTGCVLTDGADGSRAEIIDLCVKDYTHAINAHDAPTLFKKRIVMDTDRFEGLVTRPPRRSQRNKRFLDIAREVAACHG